MMLTFNTCTFRAANKGDGAFPCLHTCCMGGYLQPLRLLVGPCKTEALKHALQRAEEQANKSVLCDGVECLIIEYIWQHAWKESILIEKNIHTAPKRNGEGSRFLKTPKRR